MGPSAKKATATDHDRLRLGSRHSGTPKAARPLSAPQLPDRKAPHLGHNDGFCLRPKADIAADHTEGRARAMFGPTRDKRERLISTTPLHSSPNGRTRDVGRAMSQPCINPTQTTLLEGRQMVPLQGLRASSVLCAAMRSTIGYLVLNVWTTACRRVAASWTRP